MEHCHQHATPHGAYSWSPVQVGVAEEALICLVSKRKSFWCRSRDMTYTVNPRHPPSPSLPSPSPSRRQLHTSELDSHRYSLWAAEQALLLNQNNIKIIPHHFFTSPCFSPISCLTSLILTSACSMSLRVVARYEYTERGQSHSTNAISFLASSSAFTYWVRSFCLK